MNDNLVSRIAIMCGFFAVAIMAMPVANAQEAKPADYTRLLITGRNELPRELALDY